MKEEILKKVLKSKKNLIINGKISTGKTLNIGFPIVKSMIESNESLFVLDSKCEYLKQYYDLLKEKNYNIVIINHRYLKYSEGWNFLEYPYNLYKSGQIDKSIDYLEQIGNGLFYDRESDPFWGQSAKELFKGVALGLFQDGKKEEINIKSISSMINLGDLEVRESKYLTEYFKMKDSSDISYICASGTIFAPRDTKESIISVAKQKLCLFGSRELLSKHLSKTTFDFNDIINKKTAIFFIAKDESSYLNILTSIFISQLFSILVDKENKNKNKFNFILDNFDSIAYINELSTMMSSGISRNIKFTILTRSKAYFEEQYGYYINSLINEIKVYEKNLEIKVDDEEILSDNENIESELKNSNIEYPILKDNNFQVFDLKNYVNNKYKENKINVDDILHRLDLKIMEIEKEEKRLVEEEVANSKNIKSDLEQFKVKD